MLQFQIYNSSQQWRNLPESIKPDNKKLTKLNCFLNPEQIQQPRDTPPSTKFKKMVQPPSSTGRIPCYRPDSWSYLYNRFIQSNSYASLLTTHAALKWLHSFIPEDTANLLDSSICRNLIEAAKRSKIVPTNKKLPISSEIVRKT